MNALLEDLCWRGLIAHSTDLDALGAHLDDGPIKFYVGFDPTAPSLHMGNLVQVLLARRLQQAGHKPHLLVGGATGQIGDPKETGERVMNSKEVVAGWVERIRSQVERFVSFEGDNAAVMVNNLDWTSGMSVLDFLRDVGKHFPVNRMLARDVVARRLEAGISYTEFSYVLLQSMDYRELHHRYGVTLQHGGSDQWGNITAGVELLRRSEQARVHALATPLLTKADGTKFGKTESGTVWLDRELTSPYAFHQFFLNAEDAKVVDYLKVFSFRSHEEIEALEKATENEPHKRLAQKALADDVTDIVHGIDERKAVVAAAAAIFGRGELAELSEETLGGIMRELKAPEVKLPMPLVDAFLVSGIVESKAAARRAILEGGAYLNNEKVTDPDFVLTSDHLLGGRCAIVRRGRRTIGGIQVSAA
ncbi:tyrosine--tRNA ligase [Arachnia rubra]|uniref:Tyrosine--tRNA ligase n=1 Tax=Arachnia rubra TaxID=1547448 RepID=A0ABX7Y9I1_9ACTN|nr:tyrosine--tRNA ligase [Arachnia rubra]MBB1578234.1 tyrosine--tRNA ligase [Propionibacterium sp.]MDO4645119.1 tyrosine--tRNA ligase [Propionibacteriaceae bacterium]QUC09218.1 tyrosine--tRNA ligase [Arachnia rubra]BCR80683.1 tyrosine--tRNA ligase [Arachnia rubra]